MYNRAKQRVLVCLKADFKPRADTQAWDFKSESGSQLELMV